MRQGVCLPNGGDGVGPAELAELAARAEAAGWDGVFVEDHLVHHSGERAPTTDPWIALAAIAVATERVLLGTQVTPLPRRHVWKVARETVALDHLSRGRFVFGVGLGGDLWETGYEMTREDTDLRRRARHLDEALAALAALWTGDPVTMDGEFVHLRDAVFRPVPRQRPRVPVWVGGTWGRAGPCERAARWDGFIPLFRPAVDEHHVGTPAEVRDICSFVQERRGSLDGYDVVLGGGSRDDDWGRERDRIAAVAAAGASWWVEYVPADPLEVMRRAVGNGPLGAG